MLSCQNVTVSVAGRVLVRDLSLDLQPGDCVAMLGPNGVGKTLTLLTLAGLRRPASGSVLLDGSPIDAQPRLRVAQRLGMLLQEDNDAFPASVLQAALLGRFPHHGPWRAETDADVAITREALARVDLAGIEDQDAATLSGGERRRLALARVLAQATPTVLLDEPVNHLDPSHQGRILRHLQALASVHHQAVLMSLHDAVLAARHATRVVLLFGDGRWACGPTRELLTAANLRALFGTAYAAYTGPDGTVLLPAA
jgi:iron complex transport system ATP-binding protein